MFYISSWEGIDSSLKSPYLGEMKLKRVVRGQWHAETSGVELWEGVTMVVQEEGVVAEGGHGDTDLR